MARTMKCHDQNVCKLFLLSIETHRFWISPYNSSTTEHGRNLSALVNSYVLKTKMRQKGKKTPVLFIPTAQIFCHAWVFRRATECQMAALV